MVLGFKLGHSKARTLHSFSSLIQLGSAACKKTNTYTLESLRAFAHTLLLPQLTNVLFPSLILVCLFVPIDMSLGSHLGHDPILRQGCSGPFYVADRSDTGNVKNVPSRCFLCPFAFRRSQDSALTHPTPPVPPQWNLKGT